MRIISCKTERIKPVILWHGDIREINMISILGKYLHIQRGYIWNHFKHPYKYTKQNVHWKQEYSKVGWSGSYPNGRQWLPRHWKESGTNFVTFLYNLKIKLEPQFFWDWAWGTTITALHLKLLIVFWHKKGSSKTNYA